MKKSEKVIVGVIMVAFIVFLALFSIYESNLTGETAKPNLSGTADNMDLFFIENIVSHHLDNVDMVNLMFTNKNILKLGN